MGGQMSTGTVKKERGASAVEFAIIASVLFMVLFGTIQFGIAYNRYQGLQAGAREGARLGSLQSTPKLDIINRVKDSVSIIQGTALDGPCPPSGVEDGCIEIHLRPQGGGAINTSPPDPPCNTNGGDTIIVNVRYLMEIPIPFFGNPQITITGSGEFVCEGGGT